MIDTAKITDVRRLRYPSIDDMLADAERIAVADRAGTLRRTGNWTAGQTFGHLATWMEYAFDGFPPDMNPPWIIKTIIRFKRKMFFEGPMPRGVRIPRIQGGTKGTDLMSLDDGLARLRAATARLKAGAPRQPNPIFGPLTQDQWKAMSLRHAELHLGFLHPE